MNKIFFDMDGVLADFVGGVLSLFNYNSAQQQEILSTWPAGEYDICKIITIGQNELWKVIDSAPNFWVDLFPLMEGISLFHKLNTLVDVYISTSPSRDPNSSSGKVAWMQRHINPNFRKYMVGPDKFLLAHEGAVLIDDHDVNVQKFKAAGGAAILWPQPWNSKAHLLADSGFSRLGHVLSELKDGGYVRL